jgi:aminoglycoside 6'-N-acetyltransferase
MMCGPLSRSTAASLPGAVNVAKHLSPSRYTIRPVNREDLPLLQRWLRAPEVVRWWGEPSGQAALLEEDLDEPAMRMWIVEYDGRPFAYAQDYEVHAWPQAHLAHLAAGSRALDTFIGESDMIGVGHGSVYLRALAQRMHGEGVPVVAIDPAAQNFRARRAYARAGFGNACEVDTLEGPAVLMTFAKAAG